VDSEIKRDHFPEFQESKGKEVICPENEVNSEIKLISVEIKDPEAFCFPSLPPSLQRSQGSPQISEKTIEPEGNKGLCHTGAGRKKEDMETLKRPWG
jgi:hypothetical protein